MSLQTDAPAPAWATRAAITAAGLVVLLAFLSGGTRGVGAADRDYWFSPTDQPLAQSMLPALDSPYAATWTPSSLTGRGAMAIARGRRTALRDLAAALSAGAIVLMGIWLVGTGVPIFPVLIAMLGMAASPTLWGRGIYWTADAMSPLLALVAMWAGWRWAANRQLIFLAIASVAAALAIAENPAWVCCLPAAAVFAASRVESRGHKLVAVAVVAALAACAWFGGPLPWSPLIGVQIPSMATRVGNLVREFTPIGAALVVIGVALLSTIRSDRAAVATLVAGVLSWQWLVPHSMLEPVSLPPAILGWAAVAVAIQWVQQTTGAFGARTLVTVLGVLIIGEPTLIRERMSALGQDATSEEAERVAYGFKVSDLPADAALVAESRRVDATVLLASQKAGTPALIVPQAVGPVQATLDQGRPLFAFANARAHLAPFGFIFERSFAGDTEVAAVAGRATCAPLTQGTWSDVSLLLASGSFIVHGDGPGTAPGGVKLRLTDAQPVRFVSIEPRSIPYELAASPNEGSQELDQASARSHIENLTALHIPGTRRRDPVTFTLAAPPEIALAMADDASPVTICPGITSAPLTLGRVKDTSASLTMTSTSLFGPGWHQAEADPDPFRWTSAPNSSIRVSVAPPGFIHLTITASPAARAPQNPTIALVVNACTFPAHPMPPGQGDYEWDVPANCWRAGDNQIWVSVTPLVTPHSLNGGPDMRLLGARVGAVRLKRIATQNAK